MNGVNRTIRPDILTFIQRFKKGYVKEYEDSFTNGNCYFFSLILDNLYSEGEICYDVIRGHFVYKYKSKLYDITGDVTEMYTSIQPWDTLSLDYDPLVYGRLMRDCIYKVDYNDWLKYKNSIE